jgi:DNA repair photolyase
MKYVFYSETLYEIPDSIWLALDKKMFKQIRNNNELTVKKTDLNTVGKHLETVFGEIKIIIRGGDLTDEFAMIKFKNPIKRYIFREFLKSRDISFESFE